MAAPPPTAPVKLFREEAKTESVQCPACGGPITLKGFGAVEQVSCPYCGSELSPEDSGALQILRQYARQRRESVLMLGVRGTLEDTEWEIIGIVWKECEVDGVVYPWQEFLLYNPYQGYRWLVYQMSDGHWTIGGALKGAPRSHTGYSHQAVDFKKQRYKHFQTSNAKVTYVEGEFPSQVRMGDISVAHDYIAPPHGISIEQTTTEEGGTDVAFTSMRHIDGQEVWQGFGAPDSPPSTSGVGNLVPNPWHQNSKAMWISFAILVVVWLVATIAYLGGREQKVAFEKYDLDATPFSQEIQIGEDGKKTTIEVRLSALGLSNSWAYLDVMLVNQGKEEAIGLGGTLEEWHGPGWKEGSQTKTITVGGVEGGKYLLQIVPQSGGDPAKPKVNFIGKPPKPPKPKKIMLTVIIRQDAVLTRYVVLPLLLIFLFPFLNFLLGRAFEARRWSNSDYAPSVG